MKRSASEYWGGRHGFLGGMELVEALEDGVEGVDGDGLSLCALTV